MLVSPITPKVATEFLLHNDATLYRLSKMKEWKGKIECRDRGTGYYFIELIHIFVVYDFIRLVFCKDIVPVPSVLKGRE